MPYNNEMWKAKKKQTSQRKFEFWILVKYTVQCFFLKKLQLLFHLWSCLAWCEVKAAVVNQATLWLQALQAANLFSSHLSWKTIALVVWQETITAADWEQKLDCAILLAKEEATSRHDLSSTKQMIVCKLLYHSLFGEEELSKLLLLVVRRFVLPL